MKAIAVAMNVPASAILIEGESLNTRQNAVNVKAILEAQSIQSVLLVTSAIHMPRAVAIFLKKLGIDVIPAPTDYLTVTEEPDATWQGHILALFSRCRGDRTIYPCA